MSLRSVKTYLEQQGVPFAHTTHRRYSTAHQVAVAEDVSDATFAKAVVFRTEFHFVMAVVPADCHVDVAEFRAKLGVTSLRLATEEELAKLFPDVEVGAEPPLGNLYQLPVYVDERLTYCTTITFNAGTHQDAISMEYSDFARLARPFVFPFAASNRH
jgi:Ala-tRNA(Pro) deacylase